MNTATAPLPKIPMSPAASLLAEGMLMDAEEFHRRYSMMPNLKKAELIEGVVFMPSPVNVKHCRKNSTLGGWAFHYEMHTPGVFHFNGGSVRLNSKSEVQPDVMLVKTHDGIDPQINSKPDGPLDEAPVIAIEVTVSSKTRDRVKKFELYRKSGVQEYIIWQVKENLIEWFQLVNGEYVEIEPDADTFLKSVALPGLWLDAKSLIAGNMAQVLAILNQGLASSDHATFVRKMTVGTK